MNGLRFTIFVVWVLTGPAISFLQAQAQNLCREIDGLHDEALISPRVISGELSMDSILMYSGEDGEYDVTRFFYQEDKLDSIVEESPGLNLVEKKVSYPLEDVIEIIWVEDGDRLGLRFHLSGGRMDSIVSFSPDFPSVRLLVVTYAYTSESFVTKYWNSNSAIWIDSVVYGDSTREIHRAIEGRSTQQYCVSRENSCLCYIDPGFTVESEDHRFVFLEGRLWAVFDWREEKQREYFWPGRPVSVRQIQAAKTRKKEVPTGLYRVDGRKWRQLPFAGKTSLINVPVENSGIE